MVEPHTVPPRKYKYPDFSNRLLPVSKRPEPASDDGVVVFTSGSPEE